jgi:hypothetical protein
MVAVIGVYVMARQICSTVEIELEDKPVAETGMQDIGAAVKKLSS